MLTVEYLHHTLGLFDLVIVRTVRILARGERLSLDVVLAFHHQLQHESAHLSRMSIFCRIVVSERDVICSLQHTQEVVGEDGNLVVDGGQAIRLADGIRDKGCVAHSLRNVAFIARQYKDVLEVEVSSFEYTHDWTPSAGSPWKGIEVVWKSCNIKRSKVMMSTTKSPEAIRPLRRLMSV